MRKPKHHSSALSTVTIRNRGAQQVIPMTLRAYLNAVDGKFEALGGNRRNLFLRTRGT